MNFDLHEAIRFISNGLKKLHNQLSDKESLEFTQKAFSFDEAYMREMGFYDEEEDENERDLIYDEEDAFHYILGEFYKTREYRKWKDAVIEDLIDDFLELKYDYLASIGLVEE